MKLTDEQQKALKLLREQCKENGLNDEWLFNTHACMKINEKLFGKYVGYTESLNDVSTADMYEALFLIDQKEMSKS